MKLAKHIGFALIASAIACSASAQAVTRSAAAIPAATPVQNIELARTSTQTADENDLAGGSGILLALMVGATSVAGIAVTSAANDSPG